jgi:hypothetical protein
MELERGSCRAYILYIEGIPRAFWNDVAYGKTFFTGATGTDPDFSEHRLGTFLLTKAFEDLCQNDRVEQVDFGLGDAPIQV